MFKILCKIILWYLSLYFVTKVSSAMKLKDSHHASGLKQLTNSIKNEGKGEKSSDVAEEPFANYKEYQVSGMDYNNRRIQKSNFITLLAKAEDFKILDKGRNRMITDDWKYDIEDTIFHAIDKDNSGVISKNEFVNFDVNYGENNTDAATIFDLIEESQGPLDRNAFIDLWEYYVASDELLDTVN